MQVWACRVIISPMPSGSRPTPAEFAREIAAILRARVARINASQATLANVVGISQSQLSKMLRGERHMDVDQLDFMCSTLGLDITDVVREAVEIRERETGSRLAPVTPIGAKRVEDMTVAEIEGLARKAATHDDSQSAEFPEG